jgi:hypothetical protein
VTPEERKERIEQRRLYEAEFRKKQREKKRILQETMPGRVLRDNPDYDAILAAIKKEAEELAK